MQGNERRNWLLIRGLAREQAHWGDFPQILQEFFPQDSLYYLDLPGAGELADETFSLSLSENVQRMREALSKKYPEVSGYWVISVSLGAMLALQWLKDFPEDFAGVALVNTSLRNLSPVHKRLKLNALPSLLKVVLGGSSLEKETAILNLISNQPSQSSRTAAEWARLREERPIEFSNILRQLFAASLFGTSRPSGEKHLLLLSSARDRMVDGACSMDIEKKWGIPHFIHPSAGHDLPLDDGAWVCRSLQLWLQSLGV